MAFLWYHRRLPILQMRRLPLVFTAMGMLHIYWVLCMIGYVISPVAPCAAEYWIMSIIVPGGKCTISRQISGLMCIGIATFQIANSQFLHIASQQKRYTSVQSLEELVRGRNVSALDGKTGSLWQRIWQRLQNMDRITRMVIYVSMGMALQVNICFSNSWHRI